DLRHRQRGEERGVGARALAARLAHVAADHRDEARAVALETGEVLVARALVDAALAAELGLDRLDRNAVRLHRAVAAALTHALVDDDAPVGLGKLAALAQAARLGRAGLVVDERGDALDLAQRLLDRIQVVAVVHRDAGGKRAGRILVRIVAHD